MQLVPVYAGEAAGQADPAVPEPAGVIRIGAAKQQLIGVRTDEVRRAPSSDVLRVSGRVAADEARLYRIVAAEDGWIRELGANPAGTMVKRNETLATYYTKDLLSAEQTYLYALVTNAQQAPTNVPGYDPTTGPRRSSTTLTFQIAIDTLRNLGMSDRQIAEMTKTRTSGDLIEVFCPVNGFVIARNISPEQRFEKGSEMYRIADLSHVWVTADIFEKDRELVRPGAPATVRYRDRKFTARMSDSLPQFDPQSRTLRTRFELDNPAYFLRPDMFVDVEIQVKMPAAVTVADGAILDSGLRKTVFIDRGNGVYEPRLVKTGWQIGDRVQILDGLEPGERIVVDGNFLIDSESRMNAPELASAPAATEKDPVCGMAVDPQSPGAIELRVGTRVYYFCSDKCRKDFEADRAKYLP